MEIINDVLEDVKKEEWRQSNSTIAMQIAKVTESFGQELAEKWSNESSSVSSLETNVGKLINTHNKTQFNFTITVF